MGLHPIAKEILDGQQSLVAVWQLRDRGLTPGEIRHAKRDLRVVHHGVLLSGNASLTDWQRWKASTLTSPGTFLAEWSGAAYFGFKRGDRWPTTVKRQGEGGPRTYGVGTASMGSFRVFFSDDLEPDTTVRDDIPMVLPGRTLLDLTARVSEKTARRYMREALRTGAVNAVDLQLQIARHHGRRSIVDFRRFAVEYGELGLHRGRSDAEALAIALLDAAGVAPLPGLNVVVGGEEADLVQPLSKLIVELDGPQFHLFITEDARKQCVWEQAGWVVRRLPTDDVYDRPHLLLETATAPVTAEERAIAASTRSVSDVVRRLEVAAAERSTVRKLSL